MKTYTELVSIEHKARIDRLLEKTAFVLESKHEVHSSSLLRGNSGIALFFAYYHLYSKDQKHLEQCFASLEHAIAYTNSNDQTPLLGTGFTGLAWSAAHLLNLGILGEEATDLLDYLRPLIVQSLELELFKGNFDIFYGLLGKALFFEEDLGHDYTSEINFINSSLISCSEELQEGTAWAEWNNSEAGVYNLGIAHGTPGVVIYLANRLKNSSHTPPYCSLVKSTIKWVLSKELASGHSMFPSAVGMEKEPSSFSRLAWCYGDLGISFMLMLTGKQLGQDEFFEKGIEVGLHAASRGLVKSGLYRGDDATHYNTGICHGLAGITYLFYKLFLLSDQEGTFKTTFQYWLDLTLDNLENQLTALTSSDIGTPSDLENPEVDNPYGLLEGIAGVGLVLLAFVNPRATGWDKLFLLKI